MAMILNKVTEGLAHLVPSRLTHRLVKLKLVQRVLFLLVDKERAELLFQHAWARRFSKHPEVLEAYWREFRELDRIVALAGSETRILDVGCGISTILHALPGIRTGVDPLAEEYKRLYKYPLGLEIRAGSAESLPFADASFDLVFCTNALDHMSSPEAALREIRRVMRPGAHLVLTVEIFPKGAQRDPAHPHALDMEGAHALLDRQGFAIEFEKTTLWIGISRYLEGLRHSDEIELIVIASARQEATGA